MCLSRTFSTSGKPQGGRFAIFQSGLPCSQRLGDPLVRRLQRLRQHARLTNRRDEARAAMPAPKSGAALLRGSQWNGTLELMLTARCFLSCALVCAGLVHAAPLSIAKQGFFYAGGHDGVDAMFVQYQIPSNRTAPWPVVMIHGQYQNGSNFLGTPDDRSGWADYFLSRGFGVYVVDQAARARSPWSASADGPLTVATVDTLERQFTGIEKFNLWPQAHLHTQWPGTGLRGDPAFEQFRASQSASLPTDSPRMDQINRAATVALLRKIGPAIVLTHSRSGTFGWEIADDVPSLVRAIVAVEPAGPPFYNEAPTATNPPVVTRQFGITLDKLTFDPAVSSTADLAPKHEAKPQAPDLVACWLPATPHKLPRLAGIPILIVTGEASYHAAYDHCTSRFLTQAGVANDFIPLASKGIHGNGHMMMLEKNNTQIAALIADWIAEKMKGRKR
jgi:pimeloyl-ACP methyl ester carboxylesterase